MLTLKNVDDSIALELSIVGYQFPEIPQDDWCLLKAIVIQDQERFEVIDPSLETTELADLLEWFTRLSEHKLPRVAHLSFTEPCIAFEFLAHRQDVVRISIILSDELKPNFKLNQFGIPSMDWNIVFELGPSDFEIIIHNIASELRRFPIRGRS